MTTKLDAHVGTRHAPGVLRAVAPASSYVVLGAALSGGHHRFPRWGDEATEAHGVLQCKAVRRACEKPRPAKRSARPARADGGPGMEQGAPAPRKLFAPPFKERFGAKVTARCSALTVNKFKETKTIIQAEGPAATWNLFDFQKLYLADQKFLFSHCQHFHHNIPS